MKILHVAEVRRGGVITVMDSLIAGQVALPDVDRVIRLCSAELACAPHEKLVDVRYARTGRDVGSHVALLRVLLRVLREEKPDVVHLHSTFAGLWGRLLAAIFCRRGKPVIIYTPHAFSFMSPVRLRAVYGVVERLLTPLASAVVCVSEDERECALEHGLDPGRLHVIRNGVAEQVQPQKANDDTLRVLFVGRFDRQKGFDVLQRAAMLLERTLPIEVRAIGAPDREVPSGPIPPGAGIQCLGWLTGDALKEQYRWADVVVVPSRWEAFAMVPLEAMSHGCAVVASDCCSLPEQVEDGKTGVLFRREDAASLADILRRTPPGRFRAMGRAGAVRQRAHFTVERMVDATTALYRNRAGSGTQRTPEAPARAHILHVVESFAAGTFGIVCQMANQQARDGYRVSLAYSLREETPADWRARLHPDIEAHLLPMQRSFSPWRDFTAVMALRRLLARLRPDIVHLHSSKAGGIGRLARLMHTGASWFFSPHGLSFLQSASAGGIHPLYLAAERVLAWSPVRFVACSASEAGLVEQYLHRKAVLVPNGISVDGIHPRRRAAGVGGVPRVGTAGRISAARNPEFFARLAERLAPRGLAFIWLGGGEPEAEERLRRAGVQVTGWLGHSELLERMAELDIYLQPSLWEGMPVAVIEAMATGLPVVATDIVGNRDLVKHGRTGWLASDEGDFADAVLRLAADPALRDEWGTSGQEHVRRHHTTQSMMESLYDAYGLASHQPRTADAW